MKSFGYTPIALQVVFFFIYASILPADEQIYPTLLNVRYIEGDMRIDFEPLENEIVTYRIYRAKTPITRSFELVSSDLVAEIRKEELPFIDHPPTDGSYNYAVTAVKEGQEQLYFVPFQNVTLYPVDYAPFPPSVKRLEIKQLNAETVELSFESVAQAASYNLYLGTEKITNLSEEEPFSTAKSENRFLVPVAAQTPYFFVVTTRNRLGVENRNVVDGQNTNKDPFTLKREVQQPPKRQVREITTGELIDRNLRNNFYRGHYRRAIDEFFSLMSNRSVPQRQAALVHFYMGQCEYYLGNKSPALKYFILAKEVEEYRAISEAWIERCLSEAE
jgi:hypothetical protein